MREFVELWGGGPRYKSPGHFPLGTDSVLLADFVPLVGAKRGFDLGCGGGILALLLLARSEKLHMTGLELLPSAAAIAEENMRENALEDRCGIVCGDIRAVRTLFRSGSADLVVANPPFFPKGSGALSPDPERAAARAEENCSLEELCTAAAWLCRTGGRFCLVHRSERLSEVFVAMSARGLEPKRLRLVCARGGAAPSLALIEGRLGGAPGLKVEPTLLLEDETGAESAELRRICHR
ncbi:MAG: methyltransferase [Oscillospiraceae bacterium]|nr:methyltransferase [Oscillospiraceae bacterium]